MSIFQRKQKVVQVEPSPKFLLLSGIDKEKLLEGYETNLRSAEQRREAIFNEIMRLRSEYDNTEVAIAAISSAVDILKGPIKEPTDPFEKLEGDIHSILENETMAD